jgi:hypothetical protein
LNQKEDGLAKIRKCKLSWKASDSDRVVGYKLYWSTENKVSYDSKCIDLGDVQEAYLPDILGNVPYLGDSIRFGITAVDKNGNESDIKVLAEAYRLTVPPVPASFAISSHDEFEIIDTKEEVSHQGDSHTEEDQLKELARMAEPLLEPARVKYYDDVGYRQLNIVKKPDGAAKG